MRTGIGWATLVRPLPLSVALSNEADAFLRAMNAAGYQVELVVSRTDGGSITAVDVGTVNGLLKFDMLGHLREWRNALSARWPKWPEAPAVVQGLLERSSLLPFTLLTDLDTFVANVRALVRGEPPEVVKAAEDLVRLALNAREAREGL